MDANAANASPKTTQKKMIHRVRLPPTPNCSMIKGLANKATSKSRTAFLLFQRLAAIRADRLTGLRSGSPPLYAIDPQELRRLLAGLTTSSRGIDFGWACTKPSLSTLGLRLRFGCALSTRPLFTPDPPAEPDGAFLPRPPPLRFPLSVPKVPTPLGDTLPSG